MFPNNGMMAGRPIVLPSNFGEGRVTKEDLEDFYRRHQEKSPTPMDAMRYGELHRKIRNNLDDSSADKYVALVEQKKKFEKNGGSWTARDQEAMDALENKALSCDDAKAAKIETKRFFKSKHKSIIGLRVRVKETGKLGTVNWSRSSNANFSDEHTTCMVDLDEGGTVSLPRKDLAVLCSLCEKNAESRCSRCLGVWYCSRECQRTDWKSHKKQCQARSES